MVSGPTHDTKSTFVEETDGYDEDEVVLFGRPRVQESRKSLPIYNHHREIMDAIEKHSVTLIRGSTGCGKSTQVPQYIYDTCAKNKKPCNIIISQPRKIAAVTIAYRVACERDVKLGNEVGYQVGLDKCTGESFDDRTQITYCTTGVVLQKLIAAKSMSAYTHLIIDEVHERSEF
jgi:ATP-dependent RNA helicase TDRD9